MARPGAAGRQAARARLGRELTKDPLPPPLRDLVASGRGPGTTDVASTGPKRSRVRLPAPERRRQLLDVGREVFARKGLEGATVEEIAARAAVSKPVVYEHFGGKEGLHAAVVDREMHRVLERFTTALAAPGSPRELLERAALVLLDYIEEDTDGFRVLVRGAPVAGGGGPSGSLISELAHKVEHILGRHLAQRGPGPELAGLYSQALVGMVALTGQWWLVTRSPGKQEVAAHLVALAYDGLASLGRGSGAGRGPGPG